MVDRFGAKTTMVITGVASGFGLMAIPFVIQSEDIGSIPGWTAFCASVLIWSTSVAAQNPSITALAQEIAPEGGEATAMALPRATGDAMYLFVPFLLGVVVDSGVPMGSECFVAGFCGLLGVAALVFF